MRNHLDIDQTQSRAIRDEIGQRLKSYLRVEHELPMDLRTQVKQLDEVAKEAPSIIPDRIDNGPMNQRKKSRFNWPWRRKG